MQLTRKSTSYTLVFFALTLLGLPAYALPDTRQSECVILLHGLWRSALAMKPLQWHLESTGYLTVNRSYPSLSYPIEELAEMAVAGGTQECRVMGAEKIHFVTHSLGGILLRQYAANHDIAGMGRAVMLGPPNQGSQVADFFISLELMDELEPQAMTQLGTHENSIVRHLGPVTFELGIIAGTFRESTMLPGFPDEPSDGTVSVKEAAVSGMADFLEMPVSHTFMIWNPAVMEQVVHFLQDGVFSREAPGDLSN